MIADCRCRIADFILRMIGLNNQIVKLLKSKKKFRSITVKVDEKICNNSRWRNRKPDER